MRSLVIAGVLFGVVVASVNAAAEDGAGLFKKHCGTCHSIEKAASMRQGPPLYGIIGRKAGTVEGFKYSDGLKSAGWIWTPKKLDEWVAFPKKLVRDTFMMYRQGDPEVRRAIIAYIESQKG
jgi:cytochrome c